MRRANLLRGRLAHEPPVAIAATSSPSCFASPRSTRGRIRSRRYICAPFQQVNWEPPIWNSRTERFGRTLQRSGFQGSILIGGTEIAWLAKQNLWILHSHLLAIGVQQADWDRLRGALPDASPAAALKVQALEDFAEQLSYCQKFNSSHKPGKRGPNGRAQSYPLPTERLIEWAEWLAKQRFENFTFLFGARRRGGRICPEI
jgi:hypothetical protein